MPAIWTHTHITELRKAPQAGRVAGSRVHDARIAALCGHHAVAELWSTDRDVTRFPGLVVVNPLVTSK